MEVSARLEVLMVPRFAPEPIIEEGPPARKDGHGDLLLHPLNAPSRAKPDGASPRGSGSSRLVAPRCEHASGNVLQGGGLARPLGLA